MDSCCATKCSAESAIDQQKAAESAAADGDNSISSASVSQGSTIGYNKIMNCCSPTKYSAHLVDLAMIQQKTTDIDRSVIDVLTHMVQSVTDVVRKDNNNLAGDKSMLESFTSNLLVTMKCMNDERENSLVSSQKTAELLARSASVARDIANMRREMYNKQLALSDIPNSQDVSYDNFVANWESIVDQCEQSAVRYQKRAELAAKSAADIRASIDETQDSFDNAKMALQQLGNIVGIDNIL